MDAPREDIEHLARALRAVDGAVTAVLADRELAAAGGLDLVAPFSRMLRFAFADALMSGSAHARHD